VRCKSDAVGHELSTLLYVDGAEVARARSSRPAEYPVSGRKPMGPTPWGEHVMKGQVIGTVNLLGPERFHREEHVAPIERLAPLLFRPFSWRGRKRRSRTRRRGDARCR